MKRYNRAVKRLAAVLVFAACGGGHARPDASSGDDAGGDGDAAVDPDAPGDGAHDPDAASIDAFPAVLDVRIQCRNDCVLVAQPPSIGVHAGTSFQVNWINVGDTDCDVNKIDQFNHVPIIIGLRPGTSYHDPVHDWCGTQFTGKFDFEIRICTLPSLIPVDCGVP